MKFRRNLSDPGKISTTRRVHRSEAAEHPPQRRKESESNRLLEILDDLAVERLRFQAFEETAAREDDPR